MTHADVAFHRVSTISLTLEQLSSRGATIVLDLDGSELSFYFERTNNGLAAWQQLRQGLRRSEDYVLNIDGEGVPTNHERAALDWLGGEFVHGRSAA